MGSAPWTVQDSKREAEEDWGKEEVAMTHEYTLLAIQQLAQLISIRRENVNRWGKATPPPMLARRRPLEQTAMARMMTPVRWTLACNQLHMVNPRTGKALGADEETN